MKNNCMLFFFVLAFSGQSLFSQDFVASIPYSSSSDNSDSETSQIKSFWFEPSDKANSVGKHKRLEIGFEIPRNYASRIKKFLSSGKDGINPFDPDQIDFRIILTDPNGAKITRYAFYYQPFIENISSDVFNEDTTSFPWRFRFAPSIIGTWKMELEMIVDGSSVIKEAGISFECIESNHKGILQVTSTNTNADRWMKFSETNEPFFAISNNISSGGFCGYVPSQNRRQMNGIQELIDVGGNFTRIELGGQSALPDWPVYNNYNEKMDEMFAFDRMVDLCEDNNVYFTLFRHHVEVMDGGNPSQASWDGVSWYENPYKQAFDLGCVEDYYTNEEIINWQNKTLRYIFSRWGYSPNMTFYSYSEVDGWYSKIFEDKAQREATGRKKIDDGGTLNERESIEMLCHWIDEQQIYIRKNLSNTILFCHSYAAANRNEKNKYFDGFFNLSDVIGVHNYGDTKNMNYKKRHSQIEKYWEAYNKPILMEEMGVSKISIYCCAGIEYHNSIWATAMMGDFGAGMDWWWDRGIHDFGYQADLKNIQAFFQSENLREGEYEPQKWDDVANFNIMDYAVKHRLLENYALKSKDNEHVLGWIHNATYYWRNLANDLPCIQSLIDTNNPGEPCLVGKNPYFNNKNSNNINGCNATESHDISTENHSEFKHERYEDSYTNNGGATPIENSAGIENNPRFTIKDLKKSIGVKKHWYKIEFYYTHGSDLKPYLPATQVLYTRKNGELNPHVPNLNDANPDFAYKVSYISKSRRKNIPTL